MNFSLQSQMPVTLLKEIYKTKDFLCKKEDTGAEDVEIGKCLENVHVVAGDSRDSEGRETFMPFDPLAHLTMKKPTKPDWWYWKNIFYPSEEVSFN